MASSAVDQKFLGQFAKNIATDNPLLSSMLYKILGLSVILSRQLIKARRERRLDPTRETKSLELYFHIIWLSREGLVLLEQYVLPMVANFGELKVLSYKLRASFYHIFVLFHNQPSVSTVASNTNTTTSRNPHPTTPPGLTSPRAAARLDKGKGRADPAEPEHNTPNELDPNSGRNSVQPTHPLEGGPVLPSSLPPNLAPRTAPILPPPPASNFLLPALDYIPRAHTCFHEASELAARICWGSHPLRLSVRVEFCAFLYDCVKDVEGSRRLAKKTVQEVYNAQEGMDDEMFEDAAELVGVLGRMMKRGLSKSVSGRATPMISRLGAVGEEEEGERKLPVSGPGMGEPI